MPQVAARRGLLVAALVGALASGAAAQTTTATQTKDFEVIAVNGSNLVVRLPEGMREMNVPDTFRFTVNGQAMSVHELQPGMKGTATITTTTTTTPVTVTDVKNGEVVMTGPGTIYVRTGGDVKAFNEAEIQKRGVKLTKDGRPAQLSDFRSGDRLSAVIVTSGPPRVVTEQEVRATLARSAPPTAAAPPSVPAAPPPSRAPAPTPARAAAASQNPAPAPPAQAPAGGSTRTLPRTATELPLITLTGLAALGLGVLVSVRRRRSMC